ncbi:PepSY-associated TM helix domain-containing protein [Herbaspirillum sp. GCM10030257]|uniref:PepSY-associated TM helix domain-containing protein n=1 Tax=Herbaspirillum sp. GCM10030257 TaxID=3273393 RepID=UPI00361229BA
MRDYADSEALDPMPVNITQMNKAVQPRGRSRRALFLRWLRQIHLYVGLWGAALGLLFGATGLLLNHRAILKIPVEKTSVRTLQLRAPEQGFSSPASMSEWVQKELQFTPIAPPIVRSQASQILLLSGRELTQPERWNVSLTRPEGAINAEYFVGTQSIKIEHVDATLIGTLTRLHMAVGVNAFWVLLTDTIAGSMILLSLTGLLLWTQLHTVRTIAVFVSIGALLGGLAFLWSI